VVWSFRSSETDVYTRVCNGLDAAIAKALGLHLPEEGSRTGRSSRRRQRAFKIEAARLVPNAVEAESMSAVPDLEEPWSPMEAEKAFLAARRVRSVIGAFL
jgi:hypothetical protein